MCPPMVKHPAYHFRNNAERNQKNGTRRFLLEAGSGRRLDDKTSHQHPNFNGWWSGWAHFGPLIVPTCTWWCLYKNGLYKKWSPSTRFAKHLAESGNHWMTHRIFHCIVHVKPQLCSWFQPITPVQKAACSQIGYWRSLVFSLFKLKLTLTLSPSSTQAFSGEWWPQLRQHAATCLEPKGALWPHICIREIYDLTCASRRSLTSQL